jgi:glutamate-1-semialdehyde aminotransferase
METTMKFHNSLKLYEKAIKLTPLAAQTYSKSYRYYVFKDAPIFLERGKGSKVWDVDGNKFVDFVCALGPVTVGYNNLIINRAIQKQLKKGISFTLPHPISIELAELITKIIPGAQMVRFLKNGADATYAAVKLARAFTGKDLILLSGYHGMHDWSTVTTENNLGVPNIVKNTSIAFTYNDIEEIEKLLDEHHGSVAGVILEPIQANGPTNNYLQELKRLCNKHNVLLIFDEVVSGFRYALGGAAEFYKVIPDLIAFGKGMANGMPISVVAGRSDILELIETKKVFISTTFGGETLSMASALETINLLSKPQVYDTFWALGSKLKDGLIQLVKQYGLSEYISIDGLAPHCGPSFHSINGFDKYDLASIFNYEMIQNGILTIGVINLSMAHNSRDIDQYLIGADAALSQIKKYTSGERALTYEGRVNPVFKR